MNIYIYISIDWLQVLDVKCRTCVLLCYVKRRPWGAWVKWARLSHFGWSNGQKHRRDYVWGYSEPTGWIIFFHLYLVGFKYFSWWFIGDIQTFHCWEPAKICLIGGFEHVFCLSIYRECHHPNWRFFSHINHILTTTYNNHILTIY
jgi:hypothetical protein